ncbi:MAG TPA: Hpt domain-containing protein [Croceibacterium sp.]|nr:Hpt domain-containing protein [Croceibacterium sp.]
MAQQAGDFDATLVAAAGEDRSLLEELRRAFAESLTQQIDLLRRARCDGNWEVAAQRLKSLGASFHAPDLVELAQAALDGAPGEPTVLRKLDTLRARFAVDPAA